jgi:hypothetical protein
MAIDWDAVVLGPVMGIFGGPPAGSASGAAITYFAADRLGQPGLPLPDAVFDEGHEVVTLEDGQPVSSVMPALGVRASRFAGLPGEPAQNGQVQIPGRGLYVVRDTQPDGQGHVTLLLNLMVPA